MIARDTNFYKLLEHGLGQLSSKNWQTFVDNFNEKYNTLDVAGFEWDNIQLDYTYEQLIVENTIATLPQYVDPDAEGLDKSFGEFVIGRDKIPTQKHYYNVDRKILRERLIMLQKFGGAALNEETKNAILNILFDATDKLIAGNRNSLTYQRMQIVSTGGLTLDADNSPRGLKFALDFGIPAANKGALTGNNRWWTSSTHTTANEGSSSDPLAWLKDKVKVAKKLAYGAEVQVELAKDLLDDLLGHTKVLKRIGTAAYPLAASATDDSSAIAYAQNLTSDAQIAMIGKIVGADIVTRDAKAAVDKFDATKKRIVPVVIDSFNPLNVAIVPKGQLGTIKAVQPIAMGSPSAIEAFFDGGRTLLTQTFNDREHTMRVESEMAMLVVPNRPQYMHAYTVTA